MTATLEQTQAELRRLIDLARNGEDVVIISEGQPVAKITGLPLPRESRDRQAWLAKLAQMRTRLATRKTAPSIETILNEDRSE